MRTVGINPILHVGKVLSYPNKFNDGQVVQIIEPNYGQRLPLNGQIGSLSGNF